MIGGEKVCGVFIIDRPQTRDDRWNSGAKQGARERGGSFGSGQATAGGVTARENGQPRAREPDVEQFARGQRPRRLAACVRSEHEMREQRSLGPNDAMPREVD